MGLSRRSSDHHDACPHELQYRTTYRIVSGKKRILNTKIVSRKNAGSYKTYEMSEAVEKRLAAYLSGMGIEKGVLETMKNTPASGIQQISIDDMLTMKLVTSVDAVRPVDSRKPVQAGAVGVKLPGNTGEQASRGPTAGTKAAPPAAAGAARERTA